MRSPRASVEAPKVVPVLTPHPVFLQIFQYQTITNNKTEYNSVQGCLEAIDNNTGNPGIVRNLIEPMLKDISSSHCSESSQIDGK